MHFVFHQDSDSAIHTRFIAMGMDQRLHAVRISPAPLAFVRSYALSLSHTQPKSGIIYQYIRRFCVFAGHREGNPHFL